MRYPQCRRPAKQRAGETGSDFHGDLALESQAPKRAEIEISRARRETDRQSELGVLLLPGSQMFKMQEQEVHQEWRLA